MRKHGHRRQGLPYSWERLQLILDHLFSPLKSHQHNTNSEAVHAEFTSLSMTSREEKKKASACGMNRTHNDVNKPPRGATKKTLQEAACTESALSSHTKAANL